MATVDELVIQIKADVRDLNKKMKKVNRQLDDVGKKGSKGMGATNRAGKSLNTTLMGLKGSTVAVVAALAGIAKIGGVVARVGAQFEDLKDSLDSVFGSMKKGDQAMEKVFKFAQTTPFQVEDATKAFIQLKSAGIEPSMEQLQVFADTASVSVDQLGTFQALIRTVQRSASGGMGLEELNMIMDRGIDVLGIFKQELNLGKDDIAAFGKTAEGAQLLVEAMTKGLEKKFGGAMENKMDNLSTKASNMTIAFKQLGDDVFKSGLGPFLKEMADALANMATSILETRQAVRGEKTRSKFEPIQGNEVEKEDARRGNLKIATDEYNRIFDEIVTLSRMVGATEEEQMLAMALDHDKFVKNKERLANYRELLKIAEKDVQLYELTLAQAEALNEEEKKTILQRGKDLNLLDQVNKAYEDSLDPLADIKELLEDDAKLLELMALKSDDAFDKETLQAYKDALADLVKQSEKVDTAMGQISQAVSQSSMSFTKDFTDALLEGESALESFRDFAKDIVSQIIAIFLQMAVVNKILNAIFHRDGLGLGGEDFDKLPTIGSAGGGTVQPRTPVLVGERGPEIFVPNTGGSILNNMNSKNAMGGGDIIINQNLNFSTGVVGTVRTEVMKLLPTISEVTKASVMDSASRGGNFAKVIRG
jgi:ABC-type transporter Mla subunit MlaD